MEWRIDIIFSFYQTEWHWYHTMSNTYRMIEKATRLCNARNGQSSIFCVIAEWYFFSDNFCVTRQCANHLITNASYELLISFGNQFLLCKSWASVVFNPMWCENKGWWINHGIIRHFKSYINQLWTICAIWRNISGSTLAQIITCCLRAKGHYLN